MYKKHLLLLAAIPVVLFACKKDDEISSGLIGTWTFISMDAHTTSTQTQEIDGDIYKFVTVSDYTTTDNAGTVIFDNSKMVIKDFTYSVSAFAFTTTYVNDELLETTSELTGGTTPLASSTAPYKMIGTDSLYLSAGTVTSGGITTPSTASGIKIGWKGDTLLVTSVAEVPAGAGYTGSSTQTMSYIKK